MSGKHSESPETADEPRLESATGIPLLTGTVVVDLTGAPGTMAARMLADLGAEVLRPVPPAGDALASLPHRAAAWTARTTRVAVDGADDPALDALLARADIVVDTPRHPGAWAVDPGTRAGRGLGQPDAVRRRRASGELAGVGHRDHGRERQPVLHR